MGNFDYAIVEEAAKQLYIKALCDLPPDVREALKKAYARETQPAARSIFEAMFKAIEIADTKKTLLCQDTGLPIYKVKIGSGYTWNGAKIKAALYEGAKRATVEFPFRSSATHDITRVNPQTSVGPGLPVTYFDFDGERSDLDILMMPAVLPENMSKMHMFYPQHGIKSREEVHLGHGGGKQRKSLPSRHHRRGFGRHSGSGQRNWPKTPSHALLTAQPDPDRRDGRRAGRSYQRHAWPHGFGRRCFLPGRTH